jgi:hypothetical protein
MGDEKAMEIPWVGRYYNVLFALNVIHGYEIQFFKFKTLDMKPVT